MGAARLQNETKNKKKQKKHNKKTGIDAVMEYGRCKTGTNDRPSLQILIKDCGEMVDEAQRILMVFFFCFFCEKKILIKDCGEMLDEAQRILMVFFFFVWMYIHICVYIYSHLDIHSHYI